MHRVYVTLLILGLAIAVGVLLKSNLEMKKDYRELQQTVANANKAEEKSAKTITKIQEKIKYVKEDCYHLDINPDIIDRVRGK